MEKLCNIEDQWGVSPDNPHKMTEHSKLLQLAYNTLGLNENQDMQYISSKFQEHIDDIIDIFNDIKDNPCEFETTVRVNRLLELVYYCQNVCCSIARIKEVLDQNRDYRDNSDSSLFRFKPICYEDNSPYQNFILFALETMHKKRYARYNGDVYHVITTPDGYNSHAWKRVGTISDVLYSLIKKETNYDQFLNATATINCVRSCSEFLSNCYDSQFPQLNKDRHAFSFKNGVYIANEDRFISYDEEIPENLVCSKYFEYDFTYAENKEDIETPFFDSIFKFQKIDDEVLEWVYAFTGRLIYEIDELDGWQVIFFVQGQAGTGKSTYANSICKQLYDEEDVGVMSNNIQKKFGLSDIVDKLLYVAPEIKRDFSIEQGEFQSIISGDKVTINIKCKESRFENWVIPGVMAGNESPAFIDNAGSIQRRLVSLRFTQKVSKGDLNLAKKLKDEMPNIIQKCNRYYREIAMVNGRENIWSVLPQYFLNTQKELAKSTNPLISFLLSESVCLDENKYMPEKAFKDAFNDHCRLSNFGKCRFDADFYLGPFAQYNIKVVHNHDNKKGTFYVGVGLANLNDDE